MQVDLFELINTLIGHTDIAVSEYYDNESFNNMEIKICIINSLISDLKTNLLFKGYNECYSVKNLKKQARDNLKEIRDFCQGILDEEESYDK